LEIRSHKRQVSFLVVKTVERKRDIRKQVKVTSFLNQVFELFLVVVFSCCMILNFAQWVWMAKKRFVRSIFIYSRLRKISNIMWRFKEGGGSNRQSAVIWRGRRFGQIVI